MAAPYNVVHQVVTLVNAALGRADGAVISYLERKVAGDAHSPVAQILAMYLLYGRETGTFFLLFWWLTAPLIVLRPFVQGYRRIRNLTV